jgi:hypothetical protein
MNLDHILELRCDLAVIGKEGSERKVSYPEATCILKTEDRKYLLKMIRMK